MKFDVKNCVVGSVSILLSILTFGLLAAPIATFMGISAGSMYDTMSNISLSGAPILWILTGIFTILALLVAVVLLVFGVFSIMNNKHVTGTKLSKIIIVTTGAIICLAGLVATICSGVEFSKANIGGGPIVLMIFAIAFIVMPFILDIIFKNKKEEIAQQ